MRRRRVKPRFYVFLLLILVGVFFLVRAMTGGKSTEATVFLWSSALEQKMPCAIIRDESVFESDSVVRVEYVAKENTEIAQGDTIANLYTTGYSESLLTKLEATRQNIQAYHKTLLGTIVDNDLDRLDTIIDMVAVDFKNLATQQTRGNLQTVLEQLETAMVNRQEYLRQNKRDDTKLTKLYDEENTRLNSIQSWRKQAQADAGGVVSFYLDGYERDLSPDSMTTLTPADVQRVIRGEDTGTKAEVLKNGVYRIVDQDKWYVAVINQTTTWNPVVGQDTWYLQIEGFEDLRYTASVVSVQKTNDLQMAIFEIEQPIGPLIYQRTGNAMLSISLNSLAVTENALGKQNGQVGVWLADVPGGTFVPVDVLAVDSGNALIQPQVDGALQLGSRLLIK